jgi:hypothetical protein
VFGDRLDRVSSRHSLVYHWPGYFQQPADIKLADYEKVSVHPRDKVDDPYHRKNLMIPLVRCLDCYSTTDYLTRIVDQVFGTQAGKVLGALRVRIKKIPKPNYYEQAENPVTV